LISIRISEPIVSVTRGPLTESLHNGHIAVVDDSGQILYQVGNPNYKTFARSTAKLLQAIPIIESGAADLFALSPYEIAVICASHNGESEHIAAVLSILAKLRLDPAHLQCGVHEPFHKETRIRMREQHQPPSSLHNNCSGKHAGMLVLAKFLESSLADYTSSDHPVQALMLETVSEMTGAPKEQIDLGIDGCGVPVFGLQIDQLAYAFARLGNQKGLTPVRAETCLRIIKSIISHPLYLAGRQRLDTRLIEATQGQVIGKMGAEGIYAVTIPASGIGITVKVEDGSQRAPYPAVIETLRQLALIDNKALSELASFHHPPVQNRRGEKVGSIEPVFKLAKFEP
jgi:L-asparaginase II